MKKSDIKTGGLYLSKYTGMIVMAYGKQPTSNDDFRAVVLLGNAYHSVGAKSKKWWMPAFEPCNGALRIVTSSEPITITAASPKELVAQLMKPEPVNDEHGH